MEHVNHPTGPWYKGRKQNLSKEIGSNIYDYIERTGFWSLLFEQVYVVFIFSCWHAKLSAYFRHTMTGNVCEIISPLSWFCTGNSRATLKGMVAIDFVGHNQSEHLSEFSSKRLYFNAQIPCRGSLDKGSIKQSTFFLYMNPVTKKCQTQKYLGMTSKFS